MLLWPAVTMSGFFLLAAVIVVLGASSTARYEFERNRVPAARTQAVPAVLAATRVPGGPASVPEAPPRSAAAQPQAARSSAGGGSTHPAGRRLAPAGSGPAWWLVDESDDRSGGCVVAGPFADAIDAEWAALSGGLHPSVRVAHGVQRGDGALVRRQPPQERAWLADLGDQLDRLPEDWDHLWSDDDALTTLVVEVAAGLVEAGLPLHDCSGGDPAGGVCLTPGPGAAGVVVGWHQHDRMSAGWVRGAAVQSAVHRTMNAAIGELLEHLGFAVAPIGWADGWLVIDPRGRGTPR